MTFTVENIQDKQGFEHQGDVKIEGTIGKNARIRITDGALDVEGSIDEGASIELISTPHKERDNSRNTVTVNQMFYYQHNMTVKGNIGKDTAIVAKNADVSVQGHIGDNCTIRLVAGIITAASLGNHTRIRNVSGSVRTGVIGNKSEINLVSGSIQIENVGNDCILKTVSGKIESNYVAGGSTLSTVSGKIKVLKAEESVSIQMNQGVVNPRNNHIYSHQIGSIFGKGTVFGAGTPIPPPQPSTKSDAAVLVLSGLITILGLALTMVGILIPGAFIALLPGLMATSVGIIGLFAASAAYCAAPTPN